MNEDENAGVQSIYENAAASGDHMPEATIKVDGLPEACPFCGHKPDSWPLGVYHLRLVAECPKCHTVAIPVRAVPR